MKAIVCSKYGPPDVLRIKEIKKPTPKKNEVLIKIHSTAVTASDTIVRGFKLSRWTPLGFLMALVIGFRKPRNPVLGMVLAGEIESTGNEVNRFNPGDKVYGWTLKPGFTVNFGTYAEYICLSQNSVIELKPSNINFAEAAAIPYGGLIAHYFVKKVNITKDQKVLIYGASGAIGTNAVQLVKALGAKVSGVCSTKNLELIKSLGAEKVIDYTKDDINEINESYDIILDAVGKNKSSGFKTQCKKLLSPSGKYISVDEGSPSAKVADLKYITKLVSDGKLIPVIDKTFQLEQMVEAHRYVDLGHKKGNVVITLS